MKEDRKVIIKINETKNENNKKLRKKNRGHVINENTGKPGEMV